MTVSSSQIRDNLGKKQAAIGFICGFWVSPGVGAVGGGQGGAGPVVLIRNPETLPFVFF